MDIECWIEVENRIMSVGGSKVPFHTYLTFINDLSNLLKLYVSLSLAGCGDGRGSGGGEWRGQPPPYGCQVAPA